MEKKYPGQKKIFGVYQKIINQIPKHDEYYELFAGSAAIAKLLMSVPNVKINLVEKDFNVHSNLVSEFTKISTDTIKSNNIFIACADALDVIDELVKNESINKKTFVFIDAPYLHSTRPNSTKLYTQEMTDIQHEKMLSSVLQLKCNVMIIHPKCDMYNSILKSWRYIDIKIRYNNKTSLERIYMNYQEPEVLHMYNFLGNDCWDRQRIKRKSDSLVIKLKKLPARERNFIINTINTEFA